MIAIATGHLHAQIAEGLVRPIRSDFAPVTPGSRDLALAAGEGMQARLEQMGVLPVGVAVVTPGGDLPVDFVIHAVVSAPDEPETAISVQKALRNALRRAVDLGLESLVLPPMGVGVGTLDAEDRARPMLEILFNHLDEAQPPLELKVVVGSEYEAEVFGQIVTQLVAMRA